MIERIEAWRREHKWSAQKITNELAGLGHVINRRTVTRHLTRLGLGQRRFLDPNGDNNRMPGKIIARWPGHMAHLDVKKVGRIPDGGGWHVHGRDSEQKRAVERAHHYTLNPEEPVNRCEGEQSCQEQYAVPGGRLHRGKEASQISQRKGGSRCPGEVSP